MKQLRKKRLKVCLAALFILSIFGCVFNISGDYEDLSESYNPQGTAKAIVFRVSPPSIRHCWLFIRESHWYSRPRFLGYLIIDGHESVDVSNGGGTDINMVWSSDGMKLFSPAYRVNYDLRSDSVSKGHKGTPSAFMAANQSVAALWSPFREPGVVERWLYRRQEYEPEAG